MNTIELLASILSDNAATRGRLLKQHPQFFREFSGEKAISTLRREGVTKSEGFELAKVASVPVLERDTFKAVSAEWQEAKRIADTLPAIIAKAEKKLAKQASKVKA